MGFKGVTKLPAPRFSVSTNGKDKSTPFALEKKIIALCSFFQVKKDEVKETRKL